MIKDLSDMQIKLKYLKAVQAKSSLRKQHPLSGHPKPEIIGSTFSSIQTQETSNKWRLSANASWKAGKHFYFEHNLPGTVLLGVLHPCSLSVVRPRLHN